MIDYSLYILARLISFLVRLLPLGMALWCGRAVGFIAYCAKRNRRRVAYCNLKAALGEEKNPSQLLEITKRTFQNLGQTLIEVLIFPKIDERYIDKYIEIEGSERIKEALTLGKGIILLTGHFGNWELSSLVTAIAIKGYPMKVLAREQKHPKLNELLDSYREIGGCKVIPKGIATREIIRSLRSNQIVGMLTDQDGGKRGTLVDFFGRQASTPSGAMRFAQATDCQVLPAVIVRKRGPYHRMIINPPLALQKSADFACDIQTNLQQFARILEFYIRKYPDQWLWLHKRWKSSPQRSIAVLSDGKAGHLRQSLAVTDAIERSIKEKDPRCSIPDVSENLKSEQTPGIQYPKSMPLPRHKIIEVKFKSTFHRALLTILSFFASPGCQGCMRCVRFCLTQETYETFIKTYSDVVISAGSSLCGANLFLSKENCSKSITIMKPWPLRTKMFDLVVIPQHDRPPTKKNILITRIAPNMIDEEYIHRQVERLSEKVPGLASQDPSENLRIGVFIGGDTPEYSLSIALMSRIANELITVANKLNGKIFLTTSRRTAKEIENVIKRKLGSHKKCRLLVIANESNIEEAVGGILGLAHIVLVSGESVSMVSEAVNSRKYVLVFEPAKKEKQWPWITKRITKHERFLTDLTRHGCIVIVKPEEISETIERIWQEKPPIKTLEEQRAIFEAVEKIL